MREGKSRKVEGGHVEYCSRVVVKLMVGQAGS